MSVNVGAEHGCRMFSCKQTFLAGQLSGGPCLSGLIWQQQIVFMAAPSAINQACYWGPGRQQQGSCRRYGDRLWKQSHKRYRVLAWNKEKGKDRGIEGWASPVLVVSSLDRIRLQLEWDNTELSQPLSVQKEFIQYNTTTFTQIHGFARGSIRWNFKYCCTVVPLW